MNFQYLELQVIFHLWWVKITWICWGVTEVYNAFMVGCLSLNTTRAFLSIQSHDPVACQTSCIYWSVTNCSVVCLEQFPYNAGKTMSQEPTQSYKNHCILSCLVLGSSHWPQTTSLWTSIDEPDTSLSCIFLQSVFGFRCYCNIQQMTSMTQQDWSHFGNLIFIMTGLNHYLFNLSKSYHLLPLSMS